MGLLDELTSGGQATARGATASATDALVVHLVVAGDQPPTGALTTCDSRLAAPEAARRGWGALFDRHHDDGRVVL
jgi:hypothetical protein